MAAGRRVQKSLSCKQHAKSPDTQGTNSIPTSALCFTSTTHSLAATLLLFSPSRVLLAGCCEAGKSYQIQGIRLSREEPHSALASPTLPSMGLAPEQYPPLAPVVKGAVHKILGSFACVHVHPVHHHPPPDCIPHPRFSFLTLVGSLLGRLRLVFWVDLGHSPCCPHPFRITFKSQEKLARSPRLRA